VFGEDAQAGLGRRSIATGEGTETALDHPILKGVEADDHKATAGL
jgi:hypothetical protein